MEGCMDPAAAQANMQCANRCMESFKLDGCSGEQCMRISEKLQACVAKCGDPAGAMEVCIQKKCETPDRNHAQCLERSSQCVVPDRCGTVDVPACQAGHALLDRCRPKQ
jgi:hypothetical protein